MATEAARLKSKNPLVRKRKTDLTLTGLLMEGLGPITAVLQGTSVEYRREVVPPLRDKHPHTQPIVCAPVTCRTYSH
jgi:hypothetical protein